MNVTSASSSLVMVPVPTAERFTVLLAESSVCLSPTVKVSSCSTTSSSLVPTIKVLVSPAVPVKVISVT